MRYLVDVFKHYLDLVLKFNVFFYAATGAFMSFYLTKTEIANMRYSLVFMAALSVGFACFFGYAATRVTALRQEISRMIVGLGLNVLPEMHVLTFALSVTAILLGLVTGGFLLIFFHGL
jgi:hypothetical protein